MKILISGANGEVGKAASEQLAKEGNELILVSRNPIGLENRIKALKNINSINHSAFVVDFDNEETIHGCLNRVDEINGVVINPPRIPSSDELFPEETEWIEVFRRVFFNPLLLLKEAILKMPANSRSKVVFISGISSIQVMTKYAVNSSIRAAWAAQAKTLSMNYSHVHFNTVSLGGIYSDAYSKKLKEKSNNLGKPEEEIYADDLWNVPLKKYASLSEVAKTISGLLGPFSDHLTGNNIILDGGYTKTF